MISGCPAPRILLLLLLCLCTYCAMAQPTLPDLTGSADKGVVVLSWNCQYGSVKSISVLRSADGNGNYSTIGYVKNVKKGLQVFMDGHPGTGTNCYELNLIFNSGLKWTTNHFCLDAGAGKPMGNTLPSNDSIQKMLVTQDVPAARATVNNKNASGTPVAATRKEEINNSIQGHDAALESNKSYPDRQKAPSPAISVSFSNDTIRNQSATNPNMPTSAPQKKIIVSFQEPDENSYTQIKSQYIYVDPVSGHVMIDLPDDVSTHHYSVKFYDSKNEMITEIPRINTQKIILDKRNFQQKGMYKFKLRRDVVELETGYIMIVPNP